MEDVTLEEFVGWFLTSGTFVLVILGAVAWKVVRDQIESRRRIKRKMFELGITDAQGNRLPRKLP